MESGRYAERFCRRGRRCKVQPFAATAIEEGGGSGGGTDQLRIRFRLQITALLGDLQRRGRNRQDFFASCPGPLL